VFLKHVLSKFIYRVVFMKLIKCGSNSSLKVRLTKFDWMRIGQKAGWIKLAQNVELIQSSDVKNILDSLGTERFVIGFWKKNGKFRDMNAQRHVKRPYSGGGGGGEVPSGLIVFYDLQIASKIAKKALSDMDVNDYDPSLLRAAYRRTYPESIDYIKAKGKIYLVEGSVTAQEMGLE